MSRVLMHLRDDEGAKRVGERCIRRPPLEESSEADCVLSRGPCRGPVSEPERQFYTGFAGSVKTPNDASRWGGARNEVACRCRESRRCCKSFPTWLPRSKSPWQGEARDRRAGRSYLYLVSIDRVADIMRVTSLVSV